MATPIKPLRPGSRLATIDATGKRTWQYPVWFAGKLLKFRTGVHVALIAMLLLGPWIDIAGQPAIRFDIANRRAYLWGLQFFATDGIYIALVLLGALFAIFLFSALFGRAWCGWSCPQTVFLETLIRPLERLIEGSSTQRKRQDEAPWRLAKIVRKAIKFAAIATVCAAIGTTFVAYFLGREGVLQAQIDPWSHPSGTAIFLSITALTLFDFAWFREQTCLVLCPYGRFQSLLLDRDSLGVGYDFQRGEPRGKAKRKGLAIVDNPRSSGDCVDCRRCVQVCPTGIDIRNGAQMECIQCMACIDVCNDTMTKLDRKPGLIRLDSERAFAGKARRFVRPRVIAYACATFVVGLAFALSISSHAPVEIHLGRQSGATYSILPDGRLQNPLQVRIANKTATARTFTVDLLAPTSATVFIPSTNLTVAAGDVIHIPFFVALEERFSGESIVVRIRDDQGFSSEQSVDFLTRDRAHSQSTRPAAPN